MGIHDAAFEVIGIWIPSVVLWLGTRASHVTLGLVSEQPYRKPHLAQL